MRSSYKKSRKSRKSRKLRKPRKSRTFRKLRKLTKRKKYGGEGEDCKILQDTDKYTPLGIANKYPVSKVRGNHLDEVEGIAASALYKPSTLRKNVPFYKKVNEKEPFIYWCSGNRIPFLRRIRQFSVNQLAIQDGIAAENVPDSNPVMYIYNLIGNGYPSTRKYIFPRDSLRIELSSENTDEFQKYFDTFKRSVEDARAEEAAEKAAEKAAAGPFSGPVTGAWGSSEPFPMGGARHIRATKHLIK